MSERTVPPLFLVWIAQRAPGNAVGGVVGVEGVGGVGVILASDASCIVQREAGCLRGRVGGRGKPIACVEGIAPGAGSGDCRARAAIGIVVAVGDGSVYLRL